MEVATNEFRKGLRVIYRGEPYVIVEFQHVKPGKGAAFVKTRLKNLLTGNVLDVNFRSGDKLELAETEEREMQFLYGEGDTFCFMDIETFEQVYVPRDVLGNKAYYLKDDMVVKVLKFKGEVVDVEPPKFVELRVVETEPGVKGDTVSGGSKPAKLETGLVVNVPLFINEGDILKIDTRTGEYVERVG